MRAPHILSKSPTSFDACFAGLFSDFTNNAAASPFFRRISPGAVNASLSVFASDVASSASGTIMKSRYSEGIPGSMYARTGVPDDMYSMFFEGYTTKVWGRIPAEISADWGAQRVKGVSIAALLKNVLQKGISRKNNQVETSLIEEFYYPKYGPGQLWETVAKKFAERGGKLFVDKEVNGFEREGQKIRGVKCEDGSTYACDAVFSSMPLNQLVPALGGADSTIENIASGLPYRDFVTVGKTQGFLWDVFRYSTTGRHIC